MLEEPEASLVEGPFDFNRHSQDCLCVAQEPPERDRLGAVEAGLARERLGQRLRHGADPVQARLAMMFAAGLDLAQEAGPAERDTVGNDFALCNCRAEAPGGADERLAICGLAESTSGDARRNERARA